MKVKRTETGFLVVLDVGDGVIDSLKKLAAAERIGMASFTGIGAVKDVVLGYLDLDQKEYLKREFGADSMELVAMSGNLALLNGEPVAHCHAVVGDREMRVFGGHLFEARVSVTAEIFLRVYEGEMTREFAPDFGTNLVSV
jgi:predicted DNA-binding protein with PD1-like motif